MRRLFSAMLPKPVFPSPPSDGGLLRGEEVTRDEILGVFLRRGGRCGITTVPVVVVGAHGCRSVAALVYACASPLALAHAIGLSRAPPSTLTAVAGGGGWYGASAGSRGAGLVATCVVAGGARVRSRGAHPRRSRMAGDDVRLPQAVRRMFVDAAASWPRKILPSLLNHLGFKQRPSTGRPLTTHQDEELHANLRGYFSLS